MVYSIVRSAFVAERLRRQTRNLLGSPRAGSNPAECGNTAQTRCESVIFLILAVLLLSFEHILPLHFARGSPINFFSDRRTLHAGQHCFFGVPGNTLLSPVDHDLLMYL
jgi:hypothetical protein